MSTKHPLLLTPSYDPANLLDALLQILSLRSDAALARLLDVAPPVISKMRHKVVPLGARMLIRMHEVSGLSIKDLRRLMGDTRERFCSAATAYSPYRRDDMEFDE